MLSPQYIHLTPKMSLKNMEVHAPFAAVVVINDEVTPEWRATVSEWLVEAGCLYMLAWGDDCSLWDDSVDIANLEAHDWNDIPDDKSIMTTWHEDESLHEVFYFAMSSFWLYPLIKHMVVLDISKTSRKADILIQYQTAEDELTNDRNN